MDQNQVIVEPKKWYWNVIIPNGQNIPVSERSWFKKVILGIFVCLVVFFLIVGLIVILFILQFYFAFSHFFDNFFDKLTEGISGE